MQPLSIRTLVLTRRQVVRLGGAGPVAALGARVLPLAAQEATPTGTPTPFVGATFVGETSDPDTFVAVVVADEGGTTRQVRAYVCNAATISVWLMGELAGEHLDLGAEDGARLEGTLGEDGVSGSATLADGTVVSFEAIPATGTAGLYTLTFDGH